MDPVPFREANTVLGAPGNMPDCMELPILRTKDANGRDVMISKYVLTTQEIAKLQETGVLWMGVAGAIHPPVYLTVDKPF